MLSDTRTHVTYFCENGLNLLWFCRGEKRAGVLWEQINLGWLTDSSCMQRWVASAGFTLLAFACLQLAWCSCQPVIDEYHHLKCKRKRLCEGRHDELPPAGAHGDTLGASSSSSSLASLSSWLPPVHPPNLLSPYASFSPPSILLHHLLVIRPPSIFASSCPPSVIRVCLTCVTLLSLIIFFSFTHLHASTLPALYMSACFVDRWRSPQEQPAFVSVWRRAFLSVIPLRLYEKSKFI